MCTTSVRARVCLALLGLASVSALAMLPPTLYGQAVRVPVVLLSVDGLKPDYVLEADRLGLKVPELRRLVADGAHATGVRGVTPTVTYPSHTTLLTGVSPSTHGIINNSPFDPMATNDNGWYWYAEDIKVPTLWDQVTDAGLITANVDGRSASARASATTSSSSGVRRSQNLREARKTTSCCARSRRPGSSTKSRRRLVPTPPAIATTFQMTNGARRS